jgi:hypothetical protein
MLLIFLPMKTSVATRRSFLKSSLAGVFAAGVAPQFIPARLLGANAPSNKITLGCIGLGAHGIGVNLKSFLQQDDCRIVAVCDVWGRRREEARKLVDEKHGGPGCAMIADFRALLARPDIDVAVISTPDHWHVTMAQLALAAGKKVFCEKPTLTIEEGRRLANDVAVRKAMFAVGLEDRAVIYYHKLAEAVRNGAIGKLERIKVSLPTKPVFAREEPVKVPDDLDYEMWLGPAPHRPYTPTLLDPQVWNLNQNELTSEFNGGLDRDNILPAVIPEGMIVNNAFTRISSASSDTPFNPDDSLRSWQTIPNTSLSLTMTQDCLLLCEWSGTWAWDAAYTAGSAPYTEDAVAFRIVVDGVDVTAASQFFGASIKECSTYIVGAAPVSAGAHVIQVECYIARVRDQDLRLAEEDVEGAVTINERELLVTERRR